MRGRGWRGAGGEVHGTGGCVTALREKGHQRGCMWKGGKKRGWRGAEGGGVEGVGAVFQPYVLSPSRPTPLPPHAARTAVAEVRRAHICVSAVRAPSCVGRLPLRLL